MYDRWFVDGCSVERLVVVLEMGRCKFETSWAPLFHLSATVRAPSNKQVTSVVEKTTRMVPRKDSCAGLYYEEENVVVLWTITGERVDEKRWWRPGKRAFLT
jgi:hypothetical protein